MDPSFSTLDQETQCQIKWLLASPFMQGPDAVGWIHGEAHEKNPDTWLEVTKKDGNVSFAAYAYDHNVYESKKLPNKDDAFQPESQLPLNIQEFKPREFLASISPHEVTPKEILAFSLTCLFHTCHRAWLNNDAQRFNQAFDGLCAHMPWLEKLKNFNAQVHTINNFPDQWVSYHLGLPLHQSKIFDNFTDEKFVSKKLKTTAQRTFTAFNMQSSLANLLTRGPVNEPLLYTLHDSKSKKTTGYLLKIPRKLELDDARILYTHNWLDHKGALLFVMQDGTNNKFRGGHRCLAADPRVEPTAGLNPLPYQKLRTAVPTLQTKTQQLAFIERWATSQRASMFQTAWANHHTEWYASPMAKWAIDTWCAENPERAQILDMLLPPLKDASNDRADASHDSADIRNALLIGQWRSAIGAIVQAPLPESFSLSSMGLDGP